MEAIFSQNSPQNRTLKTSIRHKNSEKGPTFSSKIPERVDIEILLCHTPVRKYHEFPPLPGARESRQFHFQRNFDVLQSSVWNN